VFIFSFHLPPSFLLTSIPYTRFSPSFSYYDSFPVLSCLPSSFLFFHSFFLLVLFIYLFILVFFIFFHLSFASLSSFPVHSSSSICLYPSLSILFLLFKSILSYESLQQSDLACIKDKLTDVSPRSATVTSHNK
jgi:hypothetical protein